MEPHQLDLFDGTPHAPPENPVYLECPFCTPVDPDPGCAVCAGNVEYGHDDLNDDVDDDDDDAGQKPQPCRVT